MSTPVQIKTAEQVRDDILNEISAQTSINDQILGSNTRSLAFAVGLELDELYYQLWRAQRAAYIRTATGEALDDRGADFGLTRHPATYAVGVVRFTTADTTTITPGALVAAPATTARDKILYATPSTGSYGTVGAGTVDVPVTAEVAGEAANLGAGTVTVLETTISGVTAVTNPAAMTLGLPREDDDAFRDRILRHIEGLSRGTLPSILNGALDFERVTLTLHSALPSGQNYIEVVEDLTLHPLSIVGTGKLGINGNTEVVSYTGINTATSPHRITGVTRAQESTSDVDHEVGLEVVEYVPTGRGVRLTSASLVESSCHVDVYVDDGTSSGVHSELRSLVEKRLRGDGTERDPGYKGGGITLDVTVASPVTVSITAVLVVEAGYDSAEVIATVGSDLSLFLNGFKVGIDVYGYQVASRIMATEGVKSIFSLVIQGVTFDGTNAADVTISSSQVARPGVIAIT